MSKVQLAYLIGVVFGVFISSAFHYVAYLGSSEYLWQRWTAWLYERHDVETWNEVQALYKKFQSEDKGWRAMRP
jgi:cell division protein FtsW (lipid II flippase)